MKIYLDNNLGVTKVEQEELTQDTIGYNILKVYIPNAVLTPYDTFTCYYGALLQNGRKVGWFAMEARTSTDADYEANYTLYKATLEQCIVSVEGKVYIGCQVLLGNSGNATLIKKNTAVVQFNVRKSVAINNDILILDTDQTTTDVLESYKNLLENALTTYATKAEVYTKAQVDALLLQKADKSTTYTKTEVDNKFLNTLSYGGLNAVNDLNLCEVNKFYWFGNSSNLNNSPIHKPSKCLVECIGVPTLTDNFIQKFADNENSYFRLNNNGNWSNWIKVNNEFKLLNFNEISDANTAVVNTICWLSGSSTSNLPINTSGLLETIGLENYHLQRFTTINYVYYRINNNGYSSWRKVFDNNVNNINIEPNRINLITDANDATVNTLYWLSGGASNLPVNTVGLLETIGYSNDYNSQRYYTRDNLIYIRFKYGGTYSEWELIKSPNVNYDSYKIFKKVGCIGDSYTAGWLRNSSGIGFTDHNGYSWVDYLSKDSGNNYVNFGISGITSKTWLSNTSQYGYTGALSNKCQAYLVGLGINDANSYPVGSSSDIGTTNETFYRWYYDLLVAIHNINDKAPIFCFTLGNDRVSSVVDINNAIKYIVNNYGSTLNLYLIDLYKYKSTIDSGVINDNVLDGHYTSTGYEALSKIIIKEFNQVIQNNYINFRYIQEIPYDVTYPLNVNNAVDSNGNPRFIDGNGTPSTITGFTATYCKWSLSGTHLMLVLAGTIANGTTIPARNVCVFELPSYILDKVTPVVSDNVERKVITMYASDISTQNLSLLLYKDTALKIYNTSSITLSKERNFYAQFDILIDSE